MLMTNRRKQVLDKEDIIAARFGVSLQNSNIFIREKKFKTKKKDHLASLLNKQISTR